MVAKFYNCTKDERYVFKVSAADMQSRGNIEIIQPSNVTRPRIRVDSGVLTKSVNYVWIRDFKRFYYVKSWTAELGYVTLDLEVDVLMSFRHELMDASVMVRRNEFERNNYLNDSNLQINAPTRVKIREFPSGFDSGKQIFYLAVVSGQGAE